MRHTRKSEFVGKFVFGPKGATCIMQVGRDGKSEECGQFYENKKKYPAYDRMERHLKEHEEGTYKGRKGAHGKQIDVRAKNEKHYVFGPKGVTCIMQVERDGKSEECGQFYAIDGGSYIACMERHLKEHEEGTYKGRKGAHGRFLDAPTICFYCFRNFADLRGHLCIGCPTRDTFYKKGIGRHLYDYEHQQHIYHQALGHFISYSNIIAEVNNKLAVYIVFTVDEDERIKKVWYVGQTGRGSRRWVQHTRSKRFAKAWAHGTRTLHFAWIMEFLSKQGANSLEAATLALLISKTKKRYGNIRFDASFFPVHPALNSAATNSPATAPSDAEVFEECVNTMFRASTVLTVRALNKKSGWFDMDLDGPAMIRHLEEIEKKKREKKQAQMFVKQHPEYKRLYSLITRPTPLTEEEKKSLVPPEEFSIEGSSTPSCSQAIGSQFSDADYTIQDLLDRLKLDGAVGASPPPKKSRPSTSSRASTSLRASTSSRASTSLRASTSSRPSTLSLPDVEETEESDSEYELSDDDED